MPKRYTLKTIRQAEATCVACGCTDTHACDGGCSWIWVDRDSGRGRCSNCSIADQVTNSQVLPPLAGGSQREG